MTDTQQPINPTNSNWLEEPKKLPETINVVSILTFIGSGLAIIGGIYTFISAQSKYDTIVQSQDKLQQAPEFLKKLIGDDPVGAARKTLENRTPSLILALVAASLCIYGAIQMRKLKKVGFGIYVIGELLPIVAYYIFIGPMTVFALIFSLVLNGVFIALYASQLKHMS